MSDRWQALKQWLAARLMHPSTRDFLREAQRTADYSPFDWLHGYVYGRWSYLYIGIGTGEHPLVRALRPIATWLLDQLPGQPSDAPSDTAGAVTFADTYHGKAVPLDAATQLVTVDEPVQLTDLEQVIPYARARDIVLKNPDHIVVLDCPCRAARPDPCEPLDVCLIIGEPFASFVAEHHPRRARWITPQEAVTILREEDARGHVHHAFFKDAMLNRFYAICNCCACCCGAMEAHRMGTPMLASSGYVARVDDERCVECGVCAEHCQFDALAVADGSVLVDAEACMGCGVCIGQCTHEALSLVRDSARGEPLEIRRLMGEAHAEAG